MGAMIWFNFSPKTKDFYSLKRFRKFVKHFGKSLSVPLQHVPKLDMAEYIVIQRELLTKLKDYLKENESNTIIWLTRVLDIARQMQNVLRPDPELNFLIFWRIFLYSLQFFAVYCAIQNTHPNDTSTHATLKQSLVEVANEFTNEAYEYTHIMRLAGARYQTILSLAAKIHMEQSIDCCGSGSSATQEEFYEILKYMQMDSAILESVIHKLGIQAFKDLNTRLKQQIEFHQRFCDQSQLQEQAASAKNHRNPFAELDFNESVDNFFDQLYDTLQPDENATMSDDRFFMDFFNMQKQF